MSYDNVLISATIEWMRTRGSDVVGVLDRHFQRTLEFRADTVTDFRGHPGPNGAERLIRWDARHPDDIFMTGFEPIVTPASFEALQNLPDSALDLAEYINNNVDSIFVSTARYYTIDGRATRWTPRNINNRFEYEVFAPGGIDVNLSMGSYHRYWNQREVLFPGGIQARFIRTAREYDASGRIVTLWANGGFDVSSLPAEVAPRLAQLPNPVCGTSVPISYWTGADRLSSITGAEAASMLAAPTNSDDVMRAEGDPMVPDDLMVGDDCLENWTVTRNCLPVPNMPDDGITAWFFADTCFAKVQRFPGTDNTTDKILDGPKPIMDGWPALRKAGFAKVDAAWPRLDNPNRTYFFFEDQYILADIQTHEIIEGPRVFIDVWPSLGRTGFTTLDAALPVGEDDVHVFKGDSYAVIRRDRETDAVTGPYKIADRWDGLREAGFTNNIDAALWEYKRDVYYFREDKYIVLNIDSTEKTYGPTEVHDNWPALADANFY